MKLSDSGYAGYKLEHNYPLMSVQSFSAVCNDDTHTLVLGTMPGIASLDAVEYYAHKRNAFWPVMMAIINQAPPSYKDAHAVSYEIRVKQLIDNGIGLWDVLCECERTGSLDSAIKTESIVVNDFAALFVRYPRIKTVVFNGKAAQKLFQKHVAPLLVEHSVDATTKQWHGLPSTSPAMASLSLEQKLQQWQDALTTAWQSD